MKPPRPVLFLLLPLLAAGCESVPPGSPLDGEGRALFEDAGPEAGLDFVHFNSASGRHYFAEIGGPGGGLLDFDGDGDLDLYAVQGALLGDTRSEEAFFPPRGTLTDRLYRNDLVMGSDGRTSVRLVDVTEAAGLTATGYGMGIAVGDIDNDGDPDLYVTNFGPNQLWENRGDGTFEDVTERSGTDDPRWSTSAAFLDFDRDGWLDLYVANYVDYRLASHRPCRSTAGRPEYCGPQAYPGECDLLLRNRGDGTFEDVSERAGILEEPGSGLGLATADFDGDGWVDLYVANDLMPNVLWRNRGDGTFENQALLAGAALNVRGRAEASMGVVAGDLDGDGDEDLFMTHLSTETNTLYLNDGLGLFSDRTAASRLGPASVAYTGFGTVLLDVENDGDLDLAAVNGAVYTIEERLLAGDVFPFDQPNQLFRNLGDGTFEDASAEAGPGFTGEETSRGLAAGDLDNDGDTDLVVFNDAGPARLLLNRAGQDRPWLGLRLVGTPGRRDMLGALARLHLGDGTRLVRRVRTDGSYCSASDPRLLFGLGDASGVESIEITWPDGSSERFGGLELGLYHTLVQGDGEGVDAP